MPVTLYLIALAVRLLVAAGFPDPAYPDAAYYVQVARELAAGRGFSVDFVWIFSEVGGAIPSNPTLPIPSNAHWMPLASVVQVPFIWLLGPTMLASLLPSALLGALLAPLAWLIARDAGLHPWVGIGAGLLAAVPALSTAFMSQPENFSLFGPLVAAALWLGARGIRGDARSFVAAGALAGVGALSRTEGWLVLASLLAAFWWARARAHRVPALAAHDEHRLSLAFPAVAAVAFVAVVTPWYIRQIAVFGSLSPSTATGKVLYLRDFSEWNSISTPATLDHLLGMGIGPLVATRLDGLGMSLLLFAVLVMGIVLLPFFVIGGLRHRRDPSFVPAALFALGLLLFCTVLTPIHVPGGQFMHSVVGLVPHAYVLTLEGTVIASAWLARRARRRDPGRVARAAVTGLVSFGILAGAWSTAGVHASWAQRRERAQAAAAALDRAGAGPAERVMSTDAAATRFWSGRGGVVLVNDPIETVEAVARAYGTRWLVLDDNDDVPLAVAILRDGARPTWVGPVAVDGEGVSVYPVCTEAADPRCAP